MSFPSFLLKSKQTVSVLNSSSRCRSLFDSCNRSVQINPISHKKVISDQYRSFFSKSSSSSQNIYSLEELKSLSLPDSAFSESHSKNQTNYLSSLYMNNPSEALFDTNLSKNNSNNNNNKSNENEMYFTLPNGIKIISEESSGPFCSAGLLIKAGSRYELPGEEGSTYVLEKTAFTKIRGLTQEQIHSKLLNIGGTVHCTSARDSLLYSAVLMPEKLESLFELLQSIVMDSNVEEEDITDCLLKLTFEQMAMKENAQYLSNELAHIQMFGGRGLGNSPLIYCPNLTGQEGLSKLSRFFSPSSGSKSKGLTLAAFHKYTQRVIRPSNIIIGATGISFDRLKELVMKYFGSWNGSQLSTSIKSSPFYPEEMDKPNRYSPYFGGPLYVQDKRLLDSMALAEANPFTEFSHFMISLPGPPSWHADIFPMAVLLSLLGGGSSFSSGGPGKGLYTRLYTRLLNAYGYIESANAVGLNYSDAGYFGIYGSCSQNRAEATIRLMIKEIFLMSEFNHRSSSSSQGAGGISSGTIKEAKGAIWQNAKHLLGSKQMSLLEESKFLSDVELERAKNQVKSNLLMGMESKLAQLENHLKNISLVHRMVSKIELLEGIDRVSFADLQRVRDRLCGLSAGHGRMLSSSPSKHSSSNHSTSSSDDSLIPFPTFIAVGSDLSQTPSFNVLLQMIEEQKHQSLSRSSSSIGKKSTHFIENQNRPISFFSNADPHSSSISSK